VAALLRDADERANCRSAQEIVSGDAGSELRNRWPPIKTATISFKKKDKSAPSLQRSRASGRPTIVNQVTHTDETWSMMLCDVSRIRRVESSSYNGSHLEISFDAPTQWKACALIRRSDIDLG